MGDSAETLRALIPLLKRKAGSLMAQDDRKGHRRMVEGARGARHE